MNKKIPEFINSKKFRQIYKNTTGMVIYLRDNNRHLVCYPYTISNLHFMAKELGIKKNWFHNKPNRWHYDIPIKMHEKLERNKKVIKVNSRDIIRIMEGANVYSILTDKLNTAS